jgi:hypothetical protein
MMSSLYLGWHPVRSRFVAADALDLRWAGDAPRMRRNNGNDADMCGAKRPDKPAYGAFEDFAACMKLH